MMNSTVNNEDYDDNDCDNDAGGCDNDGCTGNRIRCMFDTITAAAADDDDDDDDDEDNGGIGCDHGG